MFINLFRYMLCKSLNKPQFVYDETSFINIIPIVLLSKKVIVHNYMIII